jgi:hypothetical protein
VSNEEISPELLLAFVKKSYDVPLGHTIDMMAFYSLVLTVAEWDGAPGQEPQWMIEADEFLRENLYNDKIYIEAISEEEFAELTISQKAAIHNFFGSLGNSSSNPTQTEPSEKPLPLIPDIAYPAYTPSPASITNTDYSQDGSSIFKSRCTACGEVSAYMNFKDSADWINKHNSDCK